MLTNLIFDKNFYNKIVEEYLVGVFKLRVAKQFRVLYHGHKINYLNSYFAHIFLKYV